MDVGKIIWGGIAVLALPSFVLCGGVLSIVTSMPAHQGARVEGAGIVGIDAGGAFAWVVPTKTGVVLIDSGTPGGTEDLLAEIGDRVVHAILLTHGHFDHIGGLTAFGTTPVYCGPGERPLVFGEVSPGGPIPRLIGSLLGRQPAPTGPVVEAVDGSTLTFDGLSFEVVHMPGHTGGSAMYIAGGTLFTGDSLTALDGVVRPLHPLFADNMRQNVRSISKLADKPFVRFADGHSGLHANVKPLVDRFIEEHP
jgi:glyoxylase-like metal-dependent hydrolase (beta-lactamase superfamily II)